MRVINPFDPASAFVLRPEESFRFTSLTFDRLTVTILRTAAHKRQTFSLLLLAFMDSANLPLAIIRCMNTKYSSHSMKLRNVKAFCSIISCDRRLTVIRRFSGLVGQKSGEQFFPQWIELRKILVKQKIKWKSNYERREKWENCEARAAIKGN